ncbi:MAG: alpha-ketoglutarate-dependent dioxygenase AlkB [Myxococcales bacterium]|nr:alpha-ketoglutarate-dependent dioxygenase AlkB [Myxococcales bacterium]
MMQGWLFGHEPPRCDDSFAALERIPLDDGAWIDVARGWLAGHAALFDELERSVAWREESRRMYDRVVEVPRLVSVLAPSERPPIVEAMRVALEQRYATEFPRVSLALYRDGSDSVAWHGDYVARTLPEALVATVSIGAARKFLVRPTGGGASRALALGCGDLLVMGGTCQRTHQHAIPKVARAEPRIAIMFRPIWERGDVRAPNARTSSARRR